MELNLIFYNEDHEIINIDTQGIANMHKIAATFFPKQAQVNLFRNLAS